MKKYKHYRKMRLWTNGPLVHYLERDRYEMETNLTWIVLRFGFNEKNYYNQFQAVKRLLNENSN